MTSNIGVVFPFYYSSGKHEKAVEMLNEAIESVRPHVKKIVVINDGVKIPEVRGVQVVNNATNQGKGFAIKRGLNELLSNPGVKFVVEADADDDQDTKDIVKFKKYFDNKHYSEHFMVIGDRYTAPEMQNTSDYRNAINQVQRLIFSKFGYNIRDSVSGFRGYSRAMATILNVKLQSKDFGIATEEIVLAYLFDAGIEEIPLSYAKPRNSFTKSYKLTEVLGGMLKHKDKLVERGLGELVNTLTAVNKQIEENAEIVRFKLNGEEFSFKNVGEGYGN
ncbi:MAG: hypothetical protein ABH828_06435 [archaeon]